MLKKTLKIFSTILISSFVHTASAQPKLGMIAHVNSGVNYFSSSPDASNYTGTKGTGYGYFGEMNTSVIGFIYSLLLPKSRFFIGDYLGGGINFDYAKYDDPNLHGIFLSSGLAFGGQAAYAITDEIDVGVRYIIDERIWLIGKVDQNLGTHPKMFGGCARYKKFYGDILVGSGINTFPNNNPEVDYFSLFISNFRYLLKTPEKGLLTKTYYLGLRAETMSYQATVSNISYPGEHFLNLSLSFGIMY